jgi:hypothetical protein
MRYMHPIIAVTIGTGIGLLLSVVGQKQFNAHARHTCNKPGISDTHRLVTVSSFTGDANYCMHIRYLGN